MLFFRLLNLLLFVLLFTGLHAQERFKINYRELNGYIVIGPGKAVFVADSNDINKSNIRMKFKVAGATYWDPIDVVQYINRYYTDSIYVIKTNPFADLISTKMQCRIGRKTFTTYKLSAGIYQVLFFADDGAIKKTIYTVPFQYDVK